MMTLLLAMAMFQDVSSLSQAGAQAMRESRFADAGKAYSQLAEKEPANPMWRMNLGLAEFQAGNFQDAIVAFEKYLKAKPQPGAIHWMSGLARLKLQQPCDAIALLEKAKLWDASKSSIDLGDALFACGRYEKAARVYEGATIFRSNDAKLLRQVAHSYWRARLYPEAKKFFKSLAEQFADEPEFQYEYGDTLARLEGPEAGLPFLLQSAQAAPELTGVRGELGKGLLAVGRHLEAIPHLEAASAKDATLLLALSRAYRSVGRIEEAERAQTEYRAKLGTK